MWRTGAPVASAWLLRKVAIPAGATSRVAAGSELAPSKPGARLVLVSVRKKDGEWDGFETRLVSRARWIAVTTELQQHRLENTARLLPNLLTA